MVAGSSSGSMSSASERLRRDLTGVGENTLEARPIVQDREDLMVRIREINHPQSMRGACQLLRFHFSGGFRASALRGMLPPQSQQLPIVHLRFHR